MDRVSMGRPEVSQQLYDGTHNIFILKEVSYAHQGYIYSEGNNYLISC